MQTVHLVISGRVQGVGFRYFTQRKGKKLGVKGWVRNLITGEVEAVLQGSESEIKSLVELLRVGPPGSKVDSFEIQVVDSDQSMEELKIEADGEARCRKF